MSSTDDSPITLPIVTVQPTFREVIADVDSGMIPFDHFWVSCYKTSSPSVHARIHTSLDEVRRDVVKFEAKDGDVQIKRHGESNYTVACPPLNIQPTKIIVPQQEYADPERSNPQHPHRITAFDIAPDGSQFATGFLDGSVHLYLTSSSTSQSSTPLAPAKSVSKAHLSSITSLRFFPSSRVLLSAGADFTLAILPADPPQLGAAPVRVAPARLLRGHTRAITATAIVARGRNVLSAAQDGTVRLWDVAGGTAIRVLAAGQGRGTPVVGMSLGERAEAALGRQRPDGEEPAGDDQGGVGKGDAAAPDAREVETQDKLVFCALQDGTFEAFDLGAARSVYQSVRPATPASGGRTGLASIAYSPAHNLLATGSARGVVALYDTRSLGVPLTSFSRNTAAIEDLVVTDTGRGADAAGLVVATEDGLPYVASVRPEGPSVLAELLGGDCDGVRAVKVASGGDIWTAGDDGIVRKYVRW